MDFNMILYGFVWDFVWISTILCGLQDDFNEILYGFHLTLYRFGYNSKCGFFHDFKYVFYMIFNVGFI